LNKVTEENERQEGLKEQQDNDAEKNQDEELQLSLSTQAYKFFSEGNTPLEVAIALNLSESEATKFYREYWKLKQLHNLNMVYEEIKGDIDPFLRLYRLSKTKGMGINQVVNLLTIANEDLPAIEKQFKMLRNDVSTLQFRKRVFERNLYQLQNQAASTTKLLTSYRNLVKEKEQR
jgi:hypothetical protein